MGAERPATAQYEKGSVESTNCEKSAVNVSKSVETQVNESTPEHAARHHRDAKHGVSWGRAIILKSLSTLHYDWHYNYAK